MPEVPLQIKLTLEEIYDILCPECKEKLLNLSAQSASRDAITRQLREQWEKKSEK